MAAGCSSNDSGGMTGGQACKANSNLVGGHQAAAGSAVKRGSTQTTLSSGTLLLFSLEDEVSPCIRFVAGWEYSRVLGLTWSPLCFKVLEVPPQDVSFDVSLEVQRIKLACSLSSLPEQELARAVLEAKNECKQRYGTVDLWQLGTCLRSKHAYLVRHRRANASRRRKAYLRMLRHSYLVCKGLEGMEGTDVIIDLNFKDHFKLPHSVPWYDALLAAVPQDWIGTHASLLVVAKLLAAGMRLVFRQLNTPLPPWREPHAVLSKWLPESYQDEAVPLQPLPDQTMGIARMLAPYHRPFRAALASIWSSPAGCMVDGAEAGAPQPLESGALQPAAAAGGVGAPKSSGCWGGCLPRASSIGNGVGLLSDVPKKIIVGFPDQLVVPATSKGAQEASQDPHKGSVERNAELRQEGGVGASSMMTPCQQLNWRRLQYNEAKEALAAATAEAAGMGPGAASSTLSSTLSSSYKAKGAPGGEGSAHSSGGKVVNLVAVAAAGAVETRQALQFVRWISPGHFQPQDETVRGGCKTAMATTQLPEAQKLAAFGNAKALFNQGASSDGRMAVGRRANGASLKPEVAVDDVGEGVAGGRGLPLVTWVQQHITQRPPANIAAAPAGPCEAEEGDEAETKGGGEARAMVAAAAAAVATGTGVGATDAVLAARAAAAAVAAAAAAGGASRPGYKSLEQLLPKMRTVRLGTRGGL